VFPGWADSKIAAKVLLFNKEIGIISMLSKKAVSELNLKLDVVIVEMNFTLLNKLINDFPTVRFKEMPKYPAVMRDIAFVVSEEILYNDLREEILNSSKIIKSVVLFDVYSGNKLERGEKCLAFHLEYRSDEKTLTAEEVDLLQSSLVNQMAKKFEARLRSF